MAATSSTNYWKAVIETIDLISGLSAKYYQGLIQGKELPELLEEIEAKASMKLTSGSNALVAELGLESVVGPTSMQKFDQDYWRGVKDTTAYTRSWISKVNPDESVFARFLYQIRKKAVQKLGEEVNPLEQELGEISVPAQKEHVTVPATPKPTVETPKISLPSTATRQPLQELSDTHQKPEITPPTPPVERVEPSLTMPVKEEPSPATFSAKDVPALDELEQMDFSPTPPPMRPATTARRIVPSPARPSTPSSPPPRPVSPAASPARPTTPSSPPPRPVSPAASPARPTTPSPVSSPTPPETPGIPDLSLLMSEDFGDLSKGVTEERVPESIQELQRFEMEEKPISPNEPTLRDALLGAASKERNVSATTGGLDEEDELSASLKSALKLLRDED